MFTGVTEDSECNFFKAKDQQWALCQVLQSESKCHLPTWAAYNSLLTEREQDRYICQGLPLYPKSPTYWSSLYTSLKLV